MKQKLAKLMAQFQIEMRMSYRFPVIEGLAALIFLTPIEAAVLTWQHVSIGLDTLEYFVYAEFGFSGMHLGNLMFGVTQMLPILVPVLVSFTAAKSFEDGYIQTLLTYPVERVTVLLVKTICVIIIPAGLLTFTYLFAIPFIIPQAPLIGHVSIMLLGVWISILLFAILSMLVAVITKKVSATAIFGLAFGIVTPILLNNPAVPNIARVVLNPFDGAYRYITNHSSYMMFGTEMTPLIDLQIGFSISLMISLVLLALTLWLFTRSEIGG
jgi:ABC-type transport system involved in multi-copper enzyme maturation permease subunit